MLAAILLWSGLALEAGTLAGLVVRRRLRRLVLLPVLVVAIFVSTVVPLAWPATYTWTFWLARELGHAALALLMGLELGLRLLFRIREAQREARRWILGVFAGLALIAVVASFLPPVTALLPATVFAVTWLYLGLLAVSAHHGLPMDQLHKTVLQGFSGYMFVYTCTWAFAHTDTALANTLNPIAFDLFMLALLWSAWRGEALADASPQAVAYFWPWRRFERSRRAPLPLSEVPAGA